MRGSEKQPRKTEGAHTTITPSPWRRLRRTYRLANSGIYPVFFTVGRFDLRAAVELNVLRSKILEVDVGTRTAEPTSFGRRARE